MGLSTRQVQALQRSTKPINLWYGSVRSSKTYASIWALVKAIANHDGRGSIIVVGLNRDTIWRNIFVPIFTETDFQVIADNTRYRQGSPQAQILGKHVHIIGANDERAWQRIQGMTVAFCLGDEAVSWPQSFWDMLLTRLSLPTSRILVTCNPGSAEHYLKKTVIDRAETDPDIHIEKFLLRDNPSLSPAYVERLERTYTGLFYRRMILAEWVAAEGAVYQNWDPAVMTRPDPDDSSILAVGIDYGTQHPTAGYALAFTEGGLHAGWEWTPNLQNGSHRRLTDSQLADLFQEYLAGLPSQPQYIYCDPAAASFREELKTRGIITYKADNSVVNGIRTVDSLLTDGKLTIGTGCKHLHKELSSYSWDPAASEDGIDKPIKTDDDHVDALRYTVHSPRRFWQRHLT